MTIDRGFNQFDTKIDKDTGFLEVNGIFARTGVQDYYGFELGKYFVDKYKLDPMKTYGVYRPKEEVLKQESLDTYINKPITDNHPSEFVTKDNIRELEKGSVSTISTYEKDGIDYIKGRMTIKDEKTINKALSGKVEISAGYSQDLIKEKGEFNGKQYDFKQTNIRINHIALVDKGRCGDKCKITTDKKAIIESENKIKGVSMPQVTIDGVSHEVSDCVAKYIGDLNSKVTSLDEDMKKKEDEMEKLKGEKEKMKEDMEEKEKEKNTSDSTIDALVSQKVALIDTAKSLKVEVKATDSIMDMKKAIISSNSKIDLTDKSNEFIDGVYETVIASTVGKQKAIKDSQSSAFDGFDGKSQAKRTKFSDMAKEEL
jgi:hypothetical protein